jgi:YfiH family protein
MKFKNNKNAMLNTNGKAPFIVFPALSKIEFIKHGFSTRLGGLSHDCFSSMNLGYTRGDDKITVDENYKLISESIGLSWKDLVATEQVHETIVHLVTDKDRGKGIIKERDYSGVDGLITNTKGVPLVTYYADCVPLYLVDTKNKAIGLSHSGWRGTVKKMGQVTMKAMEDNFGTNPEDLVVVIGPSICSECYEVSEDVANDFRNVFDQDALKTILRVNENGKYDLNLWEANRRIFLDMNVPALNINVSEVCTCCNSDILFSHRVNGDKRGTLAAFLMIE